MNAREKIIDTWGAESIHRKVFDRMVDVFAPDAIDYLPLSRLRELLCPAIEDSSRFETVIFWFATDALPLLEEWYEFLDESDEDVEPISPLELHAALKEGVLHLSNGSSVEDFRQFVYPYFKGTDLLEAELKKRKNASQDRFHE